MTKDPWQTAESRARRAKIQELLAQELESVARRKGQVSFVANPSTTRRIAEVHLEECAYAPVQSIVPYDSLLDALRDGYHPCRICFGTTLADFLDEP